MRDSDTIASPAFILDVDALHQNLRVIRRVRERSGCKILLALKGFAMHAVFPLIRAVADGATASSLYEKLLADEGFAPDVHVYAPVYREDEWDMISDSIKHVTFNSLDQFFRYKDRLHGSSAGLRVNPRYSDVSTDLYNPSGAGSRLGVAPELLASFSELPEGIEGLHIHNLCESGAKATVETLDRIRTLYGRFLKSLSWINLGGGHLMTREGYDIDLLITGLRDLQQEYPNLDIYLEPGAAFVWDTGILRATVLDIVVDSGIQTAMLDTSFAAHMPDCLEMPYTPRVANATIISESSVLDDTTYRLGGCSCLAGDFVGSYRFPQGLERGDTIEFQDMMHYTMVKTTMFNGVNLPAIYTRKKDLSGSVTYDLVRSFTYEDFKSRLS